MTALRQLQAIGAAFSEQGDRQSIVESWLEIDTPEQDKPKSGEMSLSEFMILASGAKP